MTDKRSREPGCDVWHGPAELKIDRHSTEYMLVLERIV
jgi:hypothetical protein